MLDYDYKLIKTNKIMKVEVIDSSSNLWFEALDTIRYDIYQTPDYLNLEAIRTKTIPEAVYIQKDDKVLVIPYLLRQCDSVILDQSFTSDIFDIVSPYGYPGILASSAVANSPDFFNEAIKSFKEILRLKGVCSAFLRLHPILNQSLAQISSTETFSPNGQTVSINLNLSTTEIWRQTRPEHRTSINRCKRNGFTAKIVDYREYIDEFINMYYETMDRVGAKTYYYFDDKYFRGLMSLNEVIHLCIVEKDNEVACAGVFTECCGIVQYHLGATKSQFLKQAPSKLMFDYVRFWAKERGNEVFHLGGGLGAKTNSLYHFKAGFSNQKHSFFTLRLIIDEEKYYHLVDFRAKTLSIEPEKLLNYNFFPAYRCEI